jgi:hypothetical protein
MYIPLVRERVRVRGSRGTCLVMQVDYGREIADLECGTPEKKLVQNVPFQELFASWETPEAERSDSAAD